MQFVADPLMKLKVQASRFLPGPLYRHVTLRMHAAALASPHDAGAEVTWSTRDSRRLFLQNTSWQSYVARPRAALGSDYLDVLHRIEVPTLVLTPSYDTLVGEQAARQLRDGIPDTTEIVLDETGHMFRFTHPTRYASAIEGFLRSRARRASAAA